MEINNELFTVYFPGNDIHPTAIIHDNVRMGINNIIGAYTVIGSSGEGRAKYPHKEGYVIIGDDNVITEHVTIHSSYTEGGETRIGNNNFIMTKTHIGHDVKIGDNVTISSCAVIGGHVVIENNANIGLNSTTHQRLKISEGSMIGMGSIVTKDTEVWHITRNSDYAKPTRLNVRGAEKAGLSQQEIQDIWEQNYNNE